MVGSFHLYEDKLTKAKAFLDEGWQSSDHHMPEMPPEDPWQYIRHLLSVESHLRNGVNPTDVELTDKPYWADLERILVIYSLVRAERLSEAHRVREAFSHDSYDAFATDRIDPL